MDIKEIYNELTTKNLNLSDFNDILNLKNQCKIEMNQEYLYLSDILIIDLYINEGLYDDAINIANKAINGIDKTVFQKIYVSFIERLIYIFIQKRNFKSAYRYAFMKRNYIDLDNIDEVNRWYLEMAYIYAELNQKDKALLNLKAIVNNYPNDSLRALTLSNMTKLYIDQKQIKEAKATLGDCISLVYKLNDEEGILYCNYLNAKLCILEKNYKQARQSFQDLFKNIHNITDDYLNIANEYVSLLIDMDLYDEAYRMSIKYLKNIEDCDELEVKKNFYTNYLKIHVLRNKNIRDDVKGLLQAIEVLEKEITKHDDLIISESNEDEKRLEIEEERNKQIQMIERTINLASTGIESGSFRTTLISYSKQLQEHIEYDEATFVIFPLDSFDVLPEISDNYNKVFTYNYKKGRLYEREANFNTLNATVVEMLISQNHEIMIDLEESVLEVKDVITNKGYQELGYKSLIAIPLYNKNELFGAIIYLSHNNNLVENDVMTNFKIASKLIETKIVNQFYEENVRTLKTINNTLSKNIDKGVFYYNKDNNIYTFSDELVELFDLDSRKISLKEFELKIANDNTDARSKFLTYIDNVESYSLTYKINFNDELFLIEESAHPYITREGEVKFYFGVIKVLKNAKQLKDEMFQTLTENDLLEEFTEIERKAKTLDYKCTFVNFRIYDTLDYTPLVQLEIEKYVYSLIQTKLSPKSYLLDDGNIVTIIEEKDSKKIESLIKNLLKEFDNGYIVNDALNYFNVKAALVRFPLDTYNLKEINEYFNISQKTNEKYQVFNEKLKKFYIKKKAITACVNEHILKEDIELLYQELLTKESVSGYLLKYNINGLESNDNIKDYLDESLYIDFEKLIFKSLIKSIKPTLHAKIYFNISGNTLENLIKTNYLNTSLNEKYRNIVLSINENVQDLNNLIEDLSKYEFGIIINSNLLSSININNLNNNKFIRGIYLDNNANLEKFYKLFNLFNFEIISKDKLEKYNNYKVISNKTKKLSELLSDKK